MLLDLAPLYSPAGAPRGTGSFWYPHHWPAMVDVLQNTWEASHPPPDEDEPDRHEGGW